MPKWADRRQPGDSAKRNEVPPNEAGPKVSLAFLFKLANLISWVQLGKADGLKIILTKKYICFDQLGAVGDLTGG